MNKPLAGVRVLDLTHMLSGPYAGMILADLGAETIKVEPLQVDDVEPLRAEMNVEVGFWAEYRMSDPGGIVPDRKEDGTVSEAPPPFDKETVGWREWEVPRDLDAWYATERGGIFKRSS